MSKEISCGIVNELLPNYIDQLTSAETNDIIENHLKTCSNCAKEHDEMQARLKQTEMETVSGNQHLQKYLSKTKMMYLLKGALLSFGIIAIIVTFIVDFAINKKLSWSLIVDMGIGYAYAIGLVAVMSKKQQIIKAFAVASILILPMLYGIEVVINTNYMLVPVFWFSSYAFPITVIWLAILWIAILIKKIMKLNMWNVLGVVLILTIFGSAFTNSIAQQLPLSQIYTVGYEWIDSIAYGFGAVIVFIIGYIQKNKQKSE